PARARLRARHRGRGPPAGGPLVIHAETAARIPRLRQRLDEAGCDALLVTRLVNIRYLTGFTGSAGLLLVRADEVVLTTDGRSRDQSAVPMARAGGGAW